MVERSTAPDICVASVVFWCRGVREDVFCDVKLECEMEDACLS